MTGQDRSAEGFGKVSLVPEVDTHKSGRLFPPVTRCLVRMSGIATTILNHAREGAWPGEEPAGNLGGEKAGRTGCLSDALLLRLGEVHIPIGREPLRAELPALSSPEQVE